MSGPKSVLAAVAILSLTMIGSAAAVPVDHLAGAAKASTEIQQVRWGWRGAGWGWRGCGWGWRRPIYGFAGPRWGWRGGGWGWRHRWGWHRPVYGFRSAMGMARRRLGMA